MATMWFGRSVRSPGGAVGKKTRRKHFATDPEKSVFKGPKPGFVGPPAPVEESRRAGARPGSSSHLRTRWLVCGHIVFMPRGQFPEEETFCIQCRDGTPVR